MDSSKKVKPVRSAQPLKRPADKIRSSDYGRYVKPFRPSYEQNGEKPDMFRLMSMDYQKTWLEESAKYQAAELKPDTAKKPSKVALNRRVPKAVPRQTAPERPDIKKTNNYAHIQSRYRDVGAKTGAPMEPRADPVKPQAFPKNTARKF